jgi:hypothetical protein
MHRFVLGSKIQRDGKSSLAQRFLVRSLCSDLNGSSDRKDGLLQGSFTVFIRLQLINSVTKHGLQKVEIVAGQM